MGLFGSAKERAFTSVQANGGAPRSITPSRDLSGGAAAHEGRSAADRGEYFRSCARQATGRPRATRNHKDPRALEPSSLPAASSGPLSFVPARRGAKKPRNGSDVAAFSQWPTGYESPQYRPRQWPRSHPSERTAEATREASAEYSICFVGGTKGRNANVSP